MFLIEWGFWKMATESSASSNAAFAQRSLPDKRSDSNVSDVGLDISFKSASERPHTRGPIYAFNETYFDMRCGGSEEKRGLITLMTLGGVAPTIYAWAQLTYGFLVFNISALPEFNIPIILLNTLAFLIGAGLIYLYLRYGLHLTRLELFTSRHLLIRFNRKTQQVHLHRPTYCGGIVTFPWRETGSTSTYQEDDPLSLGMRLGLVWHPSRTGLPHMEMALLGKQGQGGSELRDEWEFIRRYMEEGPHAVPRPRLSTQLPSPIQAFSAQFEGLGRFFRKSSWLFKVALLFVWPAFVIIGTGHWLSLLLCWRPRWPKVIREAGMPGKPVPPVTTLSDYPPAIQARLLANADRWQLKPGKRPEKKPRKPRGSKSQEKPAAPTA